MKKTKRTRQLGDEIRNALATIVQRDVTDPDFGFMTFTEVELSTDLKFAIVHVSSLGKDADQKKMMEALARNKSRIRHHLAQRGGLRYTPELDFRYDNTMERAFKIEKLLHDIIPPNPENQVEEGQEEETNDDES